ncbi:hypothetical protein [Eubacterium sp.]
MIKIFKSKKNIALLCVLLAAVIAIVCIASASHGGFSKGNSSDYDVSSLTLNEDSVMKDDTIVFIGSDFTLGLKADNQSFIDYLKAVDGLNAATFTEENIGLTSKKDVSFISLVESIPKEHASPKAIFCEIPYYDAKHGTKLGEISDSYMLSDFDTETAIGAMEYIMCYAKMNWSCPVFFYTSADYNLSKKYEKLVSAAHRVSDKWNMPMLDFTSNDKIASLEKSDKSLYFVDRRNMTKAGYNEIIAPEFENFITENLYS